VGTALFHADGWTDMTKLTVAFQNFANAPKNIALAFIHIPTFLFFLSFSGPSKTQLTMQGHTMFNVPLIHRGFTHEAFLFQRLYSNFQ
jgi:hypothetical protein